MAEVKVKKELDDADVVEIEYRITTLCQQFPRGITDQVIQNDMPHLLTQQRATVVNRLLKLGRLELRVRKGKPVFAMKDTQKTATSIKMKGSDLKEKLVYQMVEDAGNKGLTSRLIKLKSNLLLPELNTILKNLESKALIKAVKSGASAKLYMLQDLQPDASVTRAAFYSDQVFVEILGQQCSKFLQSKAEAARAGRQSPMVQRNSSYATPHAVWTYIRQLGISKQDVSTEEIEALLDMLIYDGKVEMTAVAVKEGTEGSVDGQMKLYRAVQSPIVQPAGLVRAPCGLCPVFDDCLTGFEISPSTCLYMKEWLDF